MQPGGEDLAAVRPARKGLLHTHQPRWAAASGHSLVAALCLAAGLALAGHHPLAPMAAATAVMVMAAVCCMQPQAWLLLPAVLPLAGLAPWTGWLTFEEWDLLVLAAAAGGHLRLASHGLRAPVAPTQASGAAALAWLLGALVLASTVVSMFRGFADAGGFSFGWYQGYREPMNSVRLAKAAVAAMLLLPLWLHAQATDPRDASRKLVLGLSLGLLGTSLAAAWERAAFTDLANFDSDYRTTALFWEMHVGGAALDGWLALTLPFAVGGLMAHDTRWRNLLLGLCVAVACYACLTTFSRGVYLAVPVGVALTVLLQMRQRNDQRTGERHAGPAAWLVGVGLVAAAAIAAMLVFPGSGYRGLLALLGTGWTLLALPGALHGSRRVLLLAGLVAGGVLAVGVWLLGPLLPRGPYLLFAAATAIAWAAIAWQRRAQDGRPSAAPVIALAAVVCQCVGVAQVALHWGGAAALPAAAGVGGAVLLLLLLLPAVVDRLPAWQRHLRWQAATAGAMLLACAVVATFMAGSYMGGRFATSSADFEGRLLHWKRGLDLLSGPGDWLLGKGLGRYVDQNALHAQPGERPGDYRLNQDAAGPALTLIAGTHMVGWGELLRVSQRIDRPQAPVRVQLQARADKDARLHVEICQKHLLYDKGCLVKQVQVPGRPGQWQAVQLTLEGAPLVPGPWYAPRLVSFSIGTDTSGWPVAVRSLSAHDAQGHELLSNGDFQDGLAHWFFSSDRNHLPWHIKNMAMHLLFDQGLLGLGSVLALVAACLVRTTVGGARSHPLAPGLAGGTAGLLIVGLFDSLLDVPRLAALFYALMLAGVSLHAVHGPQHLAASRPAGTTSLRSSAARR